MKVAVFHYLPSGGAVRVLGEYAKRTHSRLTLYTRDPALAPELVDASWADVAHRPLPEAASRMRRMRVLWGLPREGRRLAAEIDSSGHDAVFCFPSRLTQAPEILPHLRTPTLYYAPESLRIAYEPPTRSDRRTLRARVIELGLDPYERRRKWLDRRNIQSAQRIVTHSAFTAAQLREIYGVEADVVPLGVDAASFSPPRADARDGFVLSVGALHALKGHDFVIEALATLPSPRPPLVVVGDRGGHADDLERLAASRHVDIQVRRGVPQAELVDLYHRAAVLACAQVREPFGLVTLEGMASGVPVVAVEEGGLAETVRNGVTGLLVPRNAEVFGGAVARLLSNPRLASQLVESGYSEVQRWSWDRTVAGYDRLLARVAASGRP